LDYPAVAKAAATHSDTQQLLTQEAVQALLCIVEDELRASQVLRIMSRSNAAANKLMQQPEVFNVLLVGGSFPLPIVDYTHPNPTLVLTLLLHIMMDSVVRQQFILRCRG
jgi:hypothetical protein